MDTTVWLTYVVTVLILVVTPGPSVLLATANSLKYGAGKTVGTILGDLSANLCQIILASAGLASIVVSSGELFQLIKWCGVAYLIYMGVKKLFARPDYRIAGQQDDDRNFSGLYWEGFLMSAANPKAIVFFAALFPLFLDEQLPFLPQVTLLAVTFLVLDGTSLTVYTRFAGRLKVYLEDREKVYLQNRIVGVLLIFSGIMLSLVRRSGT